MIAPREALEALDRCSIFGLDVETRPREGQPQTEEVLKDPRRCEIEWMSVATSAGAWDWEVPVGADPIEPIRRFLDDPEKEMVCHNAAFELGILFSRYGYRPKCKIWCSMVSEWMVDENRNAKWWGGPKGYGLKVLAPQLLGMEMLSYNGAVEARGSLHPELRAKWPKYCQDDAVGAIGLRNRDRPILDREGTLRIFTDLEMPMTELIAEMQLQGIRMDCRVLRKYRDQFRHELKEATDHVYEIAGRRDWVIGDPAALSTILYGHLGISFDGVKCGKSGKPSTDKESLQHLQIETNHPIVHAILRWRHLSHSLSSFFEKNLRLASAQDGYVYPKIKQTKQVTGRWSFVEPCITQAPRMSTSPFRESVVSREGFSFIGSDYSQAELRMMAHQSGDKAMTQAFLDEIDLHDLMAKETGSDRQTAKNTNFGAIYKMGARTLCRQLLVHHGVRLPIEVAKSTLAAYFDKFCGVEMYHHKIDKHLKKFKCVRDIAGRKRHLAKNMKIDYQGALRQAINFTIQASVGTQIKIAMKRIKQKMIEKGYWGVDGFHIVFQAHDEIIAEAPDEIAEECAQIMRHEMLGAIKLNVPVVSDVKIGKSWAEVK